MSSKPCVICGLPAETRPLSGGLPLDHITCPRCGDFAVQWSIRSTDISSEDRPVVSNWVYEQNQLDPLDKLPMPTISEENLPSILARHRFTFAERVNKALKYILYRSGGQPEREINMLDYKIDAILQTYNIEYVYFVLEYLRSVELLIVGVATSKVGEPRGTRMVRLTPRGIMRAEELIGAHAASVQGFVAMWFTDETTEAWDKGFYPAIDAAGYEPHRIDKTEHVNKICDEIVAEIRKSRFIVADFTGQRGGVYFEAGYALGRGIPVIWTCRKDDLSNLHFDIRQYNCIDWETPEELAQRLQARIEAVIGEGPRRSLIRVGGTAGEKDRSR